MPSGSWRLPRVTTGEARGERRGLAQGSRAREMRGCWAVPGRGRVWGGRPRSAPRGPAAPGAGFLPALRSAAPASLVPRLPRPTAPPPQPSPRCPGRPWPLSRRPLPPGLARSGCCAPPALCTRGPFSAGTAWSDEQMRLTSFSPL